MTNKTKNILRGVALGLCLIPSMMLFTACGGQLDEQATCKTSKSYSASTAAEFNEETSKNDQTYIDIAGGYRITVDTSAEGYINTTGYETKYSVKNFSNAAIKLGENPGVALRTTTSCNLVGVEGNITMESYLKDNNLYVHSLPTTITSNYIQTSIAEQKIMIEGKDVVSTLEEIGGISDFTNLQSVMDFIKENEADAKFEINKTGDNTSFKITFDNDFTYETMANIVAYVNLRYDNMITELKIEADYSTTTGAIQMQGKTICTISSFSGEIEYPNFEGYTQGSISDIKGIIG